MPPTTIPTTKQELQTGFQSYQEKENWAIFENNSNNSEGFNFEQGFESSINWQSSPEFTATTNTNTAPTPADAAWIDQLIPNDGTDFHPNDDDAAAPPITANRRDCGYARYHDLYQGGAAEHLSNEEWIARRRRREQLLRRRHRQQQRELEQQESQAR
eukprot:CAMPEP_0117057552 /NCGR_PEP_ID=MMETSP0472-20121206/39979_1 /TAXON_ID=693140 ORGANISM="Tiarina fusus, Strain LIS" /NCGR_SAMPLE_ID=MMETSP0472 /ASSEMBLY_ACC=CAM_ASM_000603 /LENGTH=157 /DNA_ID=CAMNT_0004774529 /DNA_START=63 /DNA_END=532 /DNA_ORIENTATION=-